MTGAFQHPGDIPPLLDQAQHSVVGHLPPPTGRWLFQQLLRLAGQGRRVALVLPETGLDRLEVRDTFFRKLIDAGGRVFLYPESARPTSPCLILDEARVLLPSPFRPDAVDLRDDPDSYRHYRDAVAALARAGYLPDFAGVPAPGIAVQFVAHPPEIDAGQTVALRWRADGAEAVAIEPGIGRVDAVGSRIVTLYESTTFRIQAHGPGGGQTRQLEVAVREQPRLEYRLTTPDLDTGEEIALYQRPDFPHHYGIVQGQMITLHWRTYNVEELLIEGIGAVETAGSRTLAPENLSTFVFVARGRKDTIRQPIAVNVFPVPTLEKLLSRLPDGVEIQSSAHFEAIPLPQALNIPDNMDMSNGERALREQVRALERQLDAGRAGGTPPRKPWQWLRRLWGKT